MLRGHIRELFNEYDTDIQELVAVVLDSEQEYISYKLRTSSRALREIKQNIRQTIDRMVSDDET